MNDRAEVNNLSRPPVREPLAALIGSLLGLTLIREGVGRTTIEFQATIGMQIPWVRFAAEFFAISQTLLWEWHIAVPSPRARHSPLSN